MAQEDNTTENKTIVSIEGKSDIRRTSREFLTEAVKISEEANDKCGIN